MDPELQNDEVHVWRVAIDAVAKMPCALLAHLTPEEHARAARYRHEKDRMQFQLGRGITRQLLGRYLGTAPESIVIYHEGRGKPVVAGPVRFNLSHSRQRLILAFVRERRIGVDIEQIRTMPTAPDLARRYFAKEEVDKWERLHQADQLRAFFSCWTRKEAFIKATAMGLAFPLDRFAVTFAPDEPASFVHIEEDPALAREWSLHDLSLEPDYAAALVIEGGPCKIVSREWSITS